MQQTTIKTFYSRKNYLATPYRITPGAGQSDAELQIFLHIPKCGGTTLHSLMAICANIHNQHYSRFLVRDFQPGAFIRPGWTGAWNTVKAKASSKPADIRFISGHFPFGVHRFFQRPCHYITLLRDPVRRAVSNYNYMYQIGHFDGNTPLEKIIERKLVLDNPQTRMIAGIDAMQGSDNEVIYQTAVQNLKRKFALVGVVEDAHDFIRALLAINRWPAVAYTRAQVTGIKALKKADPALAGMIADYHSLDVRLHEYAVKRWHAWKQQWIVAEPELQADEKVIFITPGANQQCRGALVKASDLGRIAANVV